ncbi:MAG: hypothetical protein ACXVBH_08575, partial [Flavisolibacter sp.]
DIRINSIRIESGWYRAKWGKQVRQYISIIFDTASFTGAFLSKAIQAKKANYQQHRRLYFHSNLVLFV